MWPLCDEMKAEPQLNWMSLGCPTVERWLLRFKTAKLGLRAGPSPPPPVCMQTVGQGRAAADCHVMLTARKLYHVHAGLQSHPNLPLQQYLLETLREHFQSFPTAHPRRNHHDYRTLSLYTTSLADAAPGNTRALSSWTSTLPSGEEDEGRLDKMRQKASGRGRTHDAGPGQLLLVVPLPAGCQVVEAIQGLQQAAQQRHSTRLLHEPRVLAQQEDDGDHQLWKEHAYRWKGNITGDGSNGTRA